MALADKQPMSETTFAVLELADGCQSSRAFAEEIKCRHISPRSDHFAHCLSPQIPIFTDKYNQVF